MRHGLPVGLPFLLVPGLPALVPGYRTARFLAGAAWQSLGEEIEGGFPLPELSLPLVAKVGLDETILSALLGFIRVPSRGEIARIRAEVGEARSVYRSSGWIDDPRAYHDEPPAMVPHALDAARVGDLRFEHIRFESEYEPWSDSPGHERWTGYLGNQTGHAWMLRHRGRPRPWLVCVHGYRMGFPGIDLAAFRARWLHYELGLNVIWPVLPLHGPRRLGWRSGEGYLAGDIMDTVHAQAQAMWDLRRVLRWLEAEGAPAIGVYGLSLGGYTAALLSALEPELACVIAGIPATCFGSLMRTHMPAWMRRYVEWHGFDWDPIHEVLAVVSPLKLPAGVPHERRFLFAGTADRLVPPHHVHALWNHWDRPRIEWYHGTHISFRWEPSVEDLLREAFVASGLVRGNGARKTAS